MGTQLLLLLLATMIWGLAFVAIKIGMQDFTPLWLNGIRYVIAGIVCLPLFIFHKTWKKPWALIRRPVIASVFLLLALHFQTLGLQYTSVAKSSFITCLYVFLVPLYLLFWGRRFRKTFWGLVFLSLVGVALLCDLRFENFNKGDMLTLLCVIFSSAHILYVERVANDFKSALEFNAIQCLSFGILASFLAFILEGQTSLSPLWDTQRLSYFSSTWSVMILAIPSAIIAFAIQVHAQKTIPAHIVSLIFLMESPFASLFGYFILGETLSFLALLGSLLIIVSVALLPFVQERVRTESIST